MDIPSGCSWKAEDQAGAAGTITCAGGGADGGPMYTPTPDQAFAEIAQNSAGRDGRPLSWRSARCRVLGHAATCRVGVANGPENRIWSVAAITQVEGRSTLVECWYGKTGVMKAWCGRVIEGGINDQ